MGTVAAGELNKMADAWAGTTTYTANAAVWVKLHVGDPGSAGTSNPAGETTRKQVTFAAASGGVATSNSQQQWTSYPNGTDVITWVSFWTASSGGTFLGRDDLPASKSPASGDTVTIASGNISLTVA